MSLSAPALSRLVEAAVRAGHGCADCHAQADALAEAVLAGGDAARALPLVEAHLDACPGCRDEFEALLTALRAGDLPPATDAPASAPTGSATPSGLPWWKRWFSSVPW